jgi:hypothetical protein
LRRCAICRPASAPISELSAPRTPLLNRPDDLMRRLDDAARYAPMERLGICPQCGFSSAAMSKYAVCRARSRPTFRRSRSSYWSMSAAAPGVTYESTARRRRTATDCSPPRRFRTLIRTTRRCASESPCIGRKRRRPGTFTRYRDVFELQDRPDLSVDRIETLYSYLPRDEPRALQRHRRALPSLAPLPRRRLSRSAEGAVSEGDDAARCRAPAPDDAAPRRRDPRRVGIATTRSTPISISPPVFRPRSCSIFSACRMPTN